MSWPTVFVMGICALGIAMEGFMVGASMLGFRRCRSSNRTKSVVTPELLAACHLGLRR